MVEIARKMSLKGYTVTQDNYDNKPKSLINEFRLVEGPNAKVGNDVKVQKKEVIHDELCEMS